MAHMTSSQSDHHEKLRKDDMEAVLQIKRTVEEKMQNPFHPSLATDKLMNISIGQILAATTLIDAKRLGLKAMDAATTTNADKIVQPKMETFATYLKKIQKKIDTVKEVIREESAVTRALCFAQNLSDEARTEAFSYEWLEYPPSLFEPEKNGYSMRKGCKSTYLSTLQVEVAHSWEPLKELPPSAADAVYVVDAMAFIQRFNTLGSSTFGQLQERYREKLLNMKPRHCTEVHFVGDQYDFGLKSLKGDERQRRESNINLPEYVLANSMKIPDWNTLLSNPCNKTNMMSYLASRWSQEASWPAGFCLVLGVNAQATRVTQTEHTDVDELYCPNHEEADTRIFAHIASCDDNNVFVIQATDTDIIVLAMYHFPRLPNVVELWVEKNDLFLSIHDLVNELAKAVGKDVLALTDTLLISYILSGCDSVSYPFKRGKKRTLKVALEHVDKHPALSNCTRHESGPSAHDQISLYKQASLSNPVLLPPEEYGRIVDGDRLIPVMKSKPSKPSAAKLKYCKCKKKPNCLRNCPCAKAAVPCIIACACNGDRKKCGRLLTDHYDDDDDVDDNVDDDDDEQYVTTDRNESCSFEIENGYIISATDESEEDFKIKIISEELGYNEDFRQFRILLIEKPLDKSFQVVFLSIDFVHCLSYYDIVSNIATEAKKEAFKLKGRHSYEESKKFLYSFTQHEATLIVLTRKLQQFNNNYLILPDYLSDAACKLKDIIEWSSVELNLAHKPRLRSDEKLAEEISYSLENFVVGFVHGKLYAVICQKFSFNNKSFVEKLNSLRGLSAKDLGIKKNLSCPMPKTVSLLKTLSDLKTPASKLNCLHNSLELVSQEIKQHNENPVLLLGRNDKSLHLTTDDIIPILVTVLVEVRPNFLEADLYYIEHFQWNTSNKDRLSYCLVTFQAAMEFIKANDFKNISGRKLSPTKPQVPEVAQYNYLNQKVEACASATSIKRTSPVDRELARITKMLEASTKELSHANITGKLDFYRTFRKTLWVAALEGKIDISFIDDFLKIQSDHLTMLSEVDHCFVNCDIGNDYFVKTPYIAKVRPGNFHSIDVQIT
ncbi:Ankyrin repeat domain-containing protein 27 [Nymphon striatum]|nr:Ankyrin repeat domain-containing protein 27 [Nymphon striatum]